MSPFETTHTTSYSPFIETVSCVIPFSRYTEVFVVSRTFLLLPYIRRLHWGDPIGVSPRSLPSECWSPYAALVT